MSEFGFPAWNEWDGTTPTGFVYSNEFYLKRLVPFSKEKEEREVGCWEHVSRWPDGNGGFVYAARIMVGSTIACDRTFSESDAALEWLAAQKELLVNPPKPKDEEKPAKPKKQEAAPSEHTEVVTEEASEGALEGEPDQEVAPTKKGPSEGKSARKRAKRGRALQTKEEIMAEIARLELEAAMQMEAMSA